MLAGMGSAVTRFIWGMFQGGYIAYAPSYILAMFVIRLISGRLLLVGLESNKRCFS